jgi:hypothetical protein
MVPITEFKVTKFEDLPPGSPVRFTHVENAVAASTRGGVVGLRGEHPTLSLDQLKAIVGARVNAQTKTSLTSIDHEELHKYDRPARRGWTAWLLPGAGLAVVLFVGVIWRKSRALVLLAVIVPMPGCGAKTPPAVRLGAGFARDRFIYDARGPELPIDLVVRNEGNVPVRIISVNAGCSCRQVDQSTLPAPSCSRAPA